jgi:hypothetical protein
MYAGGNCNFVAQLPQRQAELRPQIPKLPPHIEDEVINHGISREHPSHVGVLCLNRHRLSRPFTTR